MFLPVIWGDAAGWPSIRLPALLANPRAWPWLSRVLAMAWGWVCKHLPAGFLTFFPAMLTVPAGGSATFFCNISMESDSGSEYSLNWYKETNHSQAQKIAEISRNNPPTKTEKYLLTNHTPAFKIEILNLHQNDSGSYYCGLITFFEPDKVMESNRSHLVVTGGKRAPSSTLPSMAGQAGSPICLQRQRAKTHMALAVTPRLMVWFLWTNAIPGLFVFLLCTALALLGCFRTGFNTCCKKGACTGVVGYLWVMNRPCRVSLQKEEKPPVVSVSTVDYGVLEFQWEQHAQLPAETRVVDQTEYATIVFPEEKPDGLGKSSDANRSVTKAIYIMPWFSTSIRGSLEWPCCFPTNKAPLWEEMPKARAGVDPGRCCSWEPRAEGFSLPGAETALCTAI
uniref:Ig-like domain-containing protein n=1 Tax=Strix occidentalis caurina TaxID=311401 RepID=A0A8D0F1Q6_STROC